MIVRDRARTVADGIESRHSFSYGSAYDPDNTHFGLLLACNEDRLADGAGFPEHPHRDIEVVTWVVSGSLRHADDAGHSGVATPGVVQRMSAGTGVRHCEYAVGGPAHYVQMWLWPGSFGAGPAYDTVAVEGFAEITPLRQPDATLHAGHVAPGSPVTLPGAAYLHLLVVSGTVAAGDAALEAGDALRLVDAAEITLCTDTGAEVLAWRMRSGLPVG